MELLLGLVCFVCLLRLLQRYLSLPPIWGVVISAVLTLWILSIRPGQLLFDALSDALLGPTCVPLLVPLFVLVAGAAGFFLGRGRGQLF